MILVSVDEYVGESSDGPFRSLHLCAEGATIEELKNDASIFEMDQDGGMVRDYSVGDTTKKLYDKCMAVLAERFAEQVALQSECKAMKALYRKQIRSEPCEHTNDFECGKCIDCGSEQERNVS